jgi:hypothetical protein
LEQPLQGSELAAGPPHRDGDKGNHPAALHLPEPQALRRSSFHEFAAAGDGVREVGPDSILARPAANPVGLTVEARQVWLFRRSQLWADTFRQHLCLMPSALSITIEFAMGQAEHRSARYVESN